MPYWIATDGGARGLNVYAMDDRQAALDLCARLNANGQKYATYYVWESNPAWNPQEPHAAPRGVRVQP